MANNPNVNKVVYGNQTVMDITDTTAEEEDVVSGKTFYKASGARSTGSAVIPDISNCYQTTDTAETAIADNDYFPFYDTSATAKRKTLWSNIKAKLKAYFDGIYSTFSGSYNDLTNKPTVDKVKQNTNTAGSGGHNLLAAVTSETTAETNYVEKTADMKYYPYYRELRLTDTNGSVWTMPHGLAYGLITGVYNMDAGDTLRFPVTGTDSHIHTDCIAIPVADSKSDGTGYKFRSLKVYNGYAELVLGEDTPAATVHVGFLIYDFTTRHV